MYAIRSYYAVTYSDNFQSEIVASATTDANGAYSINMSNKISNDLLYAYATLDQLSQKLNFNVAFKSRSKLDITLYDLSGREIDKIYSRLCPSGMHQFSWDYSAHMAYLEKRICLINFRTSSSSKTVKFTLLNTKRLDFYSEHVNTSDFSTVASAGLTYTAKVEGNGFTTHVNRIVNPESLAQDFIINRASSVPFKCGATYIEQYQGQTYKLV